MGQLAPALATLMNFPCLSRATSLEPRKKYVLVGAYGFEERSLGWINEQIQRHSKLHGALMFHYKHPKGKNRIGETRTALRKLGASNPKEVPYDAVFPHSIEESAERAINEISRDADELIIDISAMTKLMILVCLCKLSDFPRTLRIVYSEAKDYSPSREEYEASREKMEAIARFPSRGFESIVRTRCLSSIRMQGQPVTLVAFTSFNEQLVRHMLGTMNPHRLLFINGRPPSPDYAWREMATQEIHRKLIEEYPVDNLVDPTGLLVRAASTLDYRETIKRLSEIYSQYGTHERIICAATGSKMQTVGLFFGKMLHPDIHIEYPTPDSYYVKGMSRGVREIYQTQITRFAEFCRARVTA